MFWSDLSFLNGMCAVRCKYTTPLPHCWFEHCTTFLRKSIIYSPPIKGTSGKQHAAHHDWHIQTTNGEWTYYTVKMVSSFPKHSPKRRFNKAPPSSRTLPIASCQTSATPAGTIVPTRMSQKEMSFFHSLQNYPSLLHCRESSQRRFRIRSSINSHYAFCAPLRWWFSITLTFHKQSRARAASVRLLAHDYVRSLWCFITLLDCTGNGTTSSFRNRNDCSPSSRSVPFAFVWNAKSTNMTNF